jgi:Zn-dependent protease with chaperone function
LIQNRISMRYLSPMPLFLIFCLVLQWAAPAFAEGEHDPLWNRPSYEKKIIDIGQRILAANGIKERISFHYVPEDIRNASAQRFLSENTIRVYKDLLDVVSSDDELAAVLSHEIAHIIDRHTRKHLTRSVPARLGVGLLAVAAVGALAYGGVDGTEAMGRAIGRTAKVGYQAMDAPISRDLEKQADLLGLDYMVKAGYNPLAMETVFTKFVGDAGPVTRFFSTHPVGTQRIAYIHDTIRQKYPQFLTPETASNPVPGSPYQFQPNAVTAGKDGKAATVQPPSATPSVAPPAAQPPPGMTATSSAIPETRQDGKALYDQLDLIAHPEKATPANSLPAPTAPPEKTDSANPVAVKDSPLGPKATNPNAPGQEALKANTPASQSSARQVNKAGAVPAKMKYEPPKLALKNPPAVIQSGGTPSRPGGSGTQPVPDSPEPAHVDTPLSVAQVLLELPPEHLRTLKLISRHGFIGRRELETALAPQEPDAVWILLNELIQKKLIRIVGADASEAYVLTDWAAAALEKPKAPRDSRAVKAPAGP